jgi:hypothetical protein
LSRRRVLQNGIRTASGKPITAVLPIMFSALQKNCLGNNSLYRTARSEYSKSKPEK